LQDVVKFAEREVGNLNPPPDRRRATLEGDLELVDGAGLVNRLAFLLQVKIL